MVDADANLGIEKFTLRDAIHLVTDGSISRTNNRPFPTEVDILLTMVGFELDLEAVAALLDVHVRQLTDNCIPVRVPFSDVYPAHHFKITQPHITKVTSIQLHSNWSRRQDALLSRWLIPTVPKLKERLRPHGPAPPLVKFVGRSSIDSAVQSMRYAASLSCFPSFHFRPGCFRSRLQDFPGRRLIGDQHIDILAPQSAKDRRILLRTSRHCYHGGDPRQLFPFNRHQSIIHVR